MNKSNMNFIFKAKYWKLSLIFGIIGWMLYLWISYMINIDFIDKVGVDGNMIFHHYTFGISKYQNIEFDILIIVIVAIGLYFGLKSVLKKNWIGYIGMLISISLLSFKFYAVRLFEFWSELN